MTLTPERLEQLRAAGRKGGKASAKRFTSQYQKAARAGVKRESLVAAGRKGFAALNAKDPGKASAILAKWRAANPSTPESIVDTWLTELGLVPDKEVPIGNLYLDRVIGSLVIEVDGHGYHGEDAIDNDRERNDRRKEALCYALGLTLIRLPEADIKSGAARQTLRENLK